MSKLIKNQVVLGKIETEYGTDPTPDKAADALLFRNFQLTPLAGGTEDRPHASGTLGAAAAIQINSHITFSFDVEIAGAGTAGGVPGYSVPLRIAGMSETVTDDTKVVYDPVSKDFESATFYFYLDGLLWKVHGCRGSWRTNFASAAVPLFSFSVTGLWAGASDTVIVAPTLTRFQTPLPVSSANTPTFTIHGYDAKMSSLTIDGNASVAYRDMVGGADVVLRDRAISGSMAIDLPSVAAKDFIKIAKENTTGALAFQHGKTAGQIVSVTAPRVQILEPAINDNSGDAQLTANLRFIPEAGDDDIKIEVK